MMRELYVTSDMIVPECTDGIKPEHFFNLKSFNSPCFKGIW